MKWLESYRVNIRQLDDQHKQAFDSFAELEKLVGEKAGVEKVSRVLARLLNELDTHFSTEEELLLIHHYPGWGKQKNDHAVALTKLRTWQESFRKGEAQALISLREFLDEWFPAHITVADRAYCEFLHFQGVF